MIITRVDPTSFAKVAGVMYAVVGLIAGVLFAVFGAISASLLPGGMGGTFGIAALIILPIMYGIIGAIVTFIGGHLFNFAAGRVGGVQFDTESEAA